MNWLKREATSKLYTSLMLAGLATSGILFAACGEDPESNRKPTRPTVEWRMVENTGISTMWFDSTDPQSKITYRCLYVEEGGLYCIEKPVK